MAHQSTLLSLVKISFIDMTMRRWMSQNGHHPISKITFAIGLLFGLSIWRLNRAKILSSHVCFISRALSATCKQNVRTLYVVVSHYFIIRAIRFIFAWKRPPFEVARLRATRFEIEERSFHNGLPHSCSMKSPHFTLELFNLGAWSFQHGLQHLDGIPRETTND